MELTQSERATLHVIAAAWPDARTVANDTECVLRLRDAGLIEEWDTWPDGRRRWIATRDGRREITEHDKEGKDD